MNNKTLEKASKQINAFNAALTKQGDIKTNGKAHTKIDPVKQVRAWLVLNRQSLKVCVEIERFLQACEKQKVTVEFMKEQVNRLLNRKFFAE